MLKREKVFRFWLKVFLEERRKKRREDVCTKCEQAEGVEGVLLVDARHERWRANNTVCVASACGKEKKK